MARFIVLVCFWLASEAFAAPLFQSSTEDSTAGWRMISAKLAKHLIEQSSASDDVTEAMSTRQRKDDYRIFFKARQIPLAIKGKSHLFVRPATSPHFGIFYGAHIFSYWIVDSNENIIFTSRSDRFSVLSASHNGMRDIEVSQCRTSECFVTRFVFDGASYVEQRCFTEEVQSRRRTAGCS